MYQYRLKPNVSIGAFVAFLAGTVVLLGIPSLFDAAIPPSTKNMTQVKLGGEEPMSWKDGSEMLCEFDSSDPLIMSWDCNGAIIQTMMVSDVRDQDVTLKRMVRAMTQEPVSDTAEILKNGDSRLIEDGNRVGMTFQYGDDTIAAVVTGEEFRPYAKLLWNQKIGKGQLPDVGGRV